MHRRVHFQPDLARGTTTILALGRPSPLPLLQLLRPVHLRLLIAHMLLLCPLRLLSPLLVLDAFLQLDAEFDA